MTSLTVNRVIHVIEEKLKGTPFEIMFKTKSEDNIYILHNPMMIISVEKGRLVKVSIHVAVRSDIASRVVMSLKEIEEIKSLDISTVFYYDVKELKMYYGSEAEEKLLMDLKIAIINDFIHEQTQLMMLKNMKVPYVC
jgi:hypothetical protein